jgi:hypothetical protein
MVYEAENIFEVDVEHINILVRKSCVFKCCNEKLKLFGCSSFCSESFLAVMQYLVSFTISRKNGGQRACVKSVYGVS